MKCNREIPHTLNENESLCNYSNSFLCFLYINVHVGGSGLSQLTGGSGLSTYR